MVVEEFSVDFVGEEKALVSCPEKWFTKLPGQGSFSFLDALEVHQRRCSRNEPQHVRKPKAKLSCKQSGYRIQKLIASLLREDLRKPPLCIFCLDDGPDVDEVCGRLQWCPKFPQFFAVHELCALMIPEVLTVDNPSSLGKQLFETEIKQLNESFVRGRKLSCSMCKEKGALVGCCSKSCHIVFHLPCAIRSGSYINYEEFRCFCPRHSSSAFEEVTKQLLSRISGSLKQGDESDLCCLCMDRVEHQMKMHSVIQTDCCGRRFYHFDCMKDATLVRGQEMRCPACNRPNEETLFETSIKLQGIYFQTYNPVNESDEEAGLDGNHRSRCYYAMTRSSAKERSCLSSLGPDRYDDSDALNDRVFNPLEALNACITCGVHCHRVCAGTPWSTYTPDGDGDEEKWQCEDCREACSSSSSAQVSQLSRTTSSRRVSGAAKRGQTHRLDQNLVETDQRQASAHGKRIAKKRKKDEVAASVTDGPLKKQQVLSKWFAPAHRHSTSPSANMHNS